MKINFKNILLASLVLAFSCSDDFTNDVGSVSVGSGEANFSNYVAIGNSLTSGFANGALYNSGQVNSFPAMIAGQMALAGGGEFKQPYMPDDIGGFSDLFMATNGTSFYGKLTLQMIDGGLKPVPSEPQKTLAETFVNGLYNNLGVPGAKSYHLLANGYGNPNLVAKGLANPYFARFASDPNTSVMEDAMKQNPTFFTLWIGNNDVLSYAASGGTGKDQAGNTNPTVYGSNDLSDSNLVIGVINNIVKKLAESGAKGAIANVPNVADIPFFTTVPSKPFSGNNSAFVAQIDLLNGYYNSLNQIFDKLGVPERKIMFDATTSNGAVIVDESLSDLSAQITGALIKSGVNPQMAGLVGKTFGQARQSNENDLFLLTTSGILGKINQKRLEGLIASGMDNDTAAKFSINGLTYPIQDEGVLVSSEVSLINNRTTAINQGIAKVASSYGLAFVDMDSKMKELKKGIMYDGVNYTTTFVTGGAFSLDGVHLTPRGYAVTANEFINSINRTYKSNLPLVDANQYGGVDIP